MLTLLNPWRWLGRNHSATQRARFERCLVDLDHAAAHFDQMLAREQPHFQKHLLQLIRDKVESYGSNEELQERVVDDVNEIFRRQASLWLKRCMTANRRLFDRYFHCYDAIIQAAAARAWPLRLLECLFTAVLIAGLLSAVVLIPLWLGSLWGHWPDYVALLAAIMILPLSLAIARQLINARRRAKAERLCLEVDFELGIGMTAGTIPLGNIHTRDENAWTGGATGALFGALAGFAAAGPIGGMIGGAGSGGALAIIGGFCGPSLEDRKKALIRRLRRPIKQQAENLFTDLRTQLRRRHGVNRAVTFRLWGYSQAADTKPASAPKWIARQQHR